MRVYVESFGCAQNLGEGREVERSLEARGHAIAPGPDGADAAVLVTCGVIGPTEARMVRRWSWLAERTPRVVVTGCLVPLRTELLTGPGRARTDFVPIREQSRIPELLERSGAVGPAGPPSPPRVEAEASATAEVVVAQGCTSACSYCFSRLARGRLQSVPMLDVLSRVALARDRGAVEVRLTSLDTSSWGEDLPGGSRLPELLDGVGALPGRFRVRVGMMSPQTLGPIAPRYFDALAHPRFFSFLHLPVQSGSDRVLDDMHRGYDARTFRRLVAMGRSRTELLTLSTDLIVGFPTEEESDFQASLRLVEEVEPEIVNVTRFSARPLTPAAHLPPLPPRVAKRRSRELTELRMRIARRRLERWIGREVDGLPVERGVHSSTVARLSNYLPVVLPGRLPLGRPVRVRVDGARSTYLLGRPVGTAEPALPSAGSK
jgi:MiaB-like tRNA modifying enzyme